MIISNRHQHSLPNLIETVEAARDYSINIWASATFDNRAVVGVHITGRGRDPLF